MEYAIRWSTNLRIMLGTCRLVGSDLGGNTYFESTSRTKPLKRWVIYKGIPEPSKVPPLWHGWLHHTLDTVPDNTHLYDWQRDHQPNLTGTPHAYKLRSYATQARKRLYQSWTPS